MKVNEDFQKKHIERMKKVLKLLSKKELLFKGGTALMFCYSLDRFSEDLDFDNKYISAKALYNTLKHLKFIDIDFKELKIEDGKKLLRAKVIYKDGDSLKIEIARDGKKPKFRPKNFLGKIKVYDINDILFFKFEAFLGRTKARDFYDVAFILDKYYEDLDKILKENIIKYIKENEDTLYRYIDAFIDDPILDEKDFEKAYLRLENAYKKYLKEKAIKKLQKSDKIKVKLK